MNQNSGFINLFHFYKNKHFLWDFRLYRTKNTGQLSTDASNTGNFKKGKKTERSSLHFPLLGADVKHCGDRGGKEKVLVTEMY